MGSKTIALEALLAAMLISGSFAAAEESADPLNRYNVTWDSPSQGPEGSMPVGNGDIGLNVWVEPDGDLLFYIGKTDAWGPDLLKLGRMRIKFSPNPFRKGLPFRQVLQLGEGRIVIRAGEQSHATEISVWVDANHPVIHVESASQAALDVKATLESWRDRDKVLDTPDDRIAWHYRNGAESGIAGRLRRHNLEGAEKLIDDPLRHRTFGGVILADGMKVLPDGARTLASTQPAKRFDLQIHVLTAQTPTSRAWLDKVEGQVEQYAKIPPARVRADHRQWWDRFWNRSWIRATANMRAYQPTPPSIPPTTVPLRIGADGSGGRKLEGYVARVRIHARELSGQEIRKLGTSVDTGLEADTDLVGDWRFDRLGEGGFANAAAPAHPAKAVGDVATEVFNGVRAARLTGDGWIEAPNYPELDLAHVMTLDAWVASETKAPSEGVALISKRPGGAREGYELEVSPAYILKVGETEVVCNRGIPQGKWTHVTASFNAHRGFHQLYVKPLESPTGQIPSGGYRRINRAVRDVREQAQKVSRAYALQRWITACAGRGAQPIKFNGSIFTVDWPNRESRGKPDYRRWGRCYWSMNTRLIYWPLLAAGDLDMMRPFFQMYIGSLPLAKERTRRYFGHEGAFFCETMEFWGLSQDGDYGVGEQRKRQATGWYRVSHIRRHWQASIEALAMMLDYYAYTQDDAFLRDDLLPYAREILTFNDQHYPRRDGKILFYPSNSLEAVFECANPMTTIAGLTFTLGKLLALPEELTGEEDRKQWKRMLSEMPPLPMHQVDGKTELAPAEMNITGKRGSLRPSAYSENPELYCVFPYRIFGVGKPDIELARTTLARLATHVPIGWCQEGTHMAYLGLAQRARANVHHRAETRCTGGAQDAEARFPGFRGPGHDWLPDQTHGGNLMMTLSTMLMQCEDSKILLFPAWPKQWDVEFKLHAPYNTTVEGALRNGKISGLKVVPESRRKDLTILPVQ